MQELILHPQESIELLPHEAIGAGEEPLRIRFDPLNAAPPNPFENQEKMWWETAKQRTGNQTAVYQRGELTKQVRIVPEMPRPDSFGFENQTLTTTSRIFKVEKADLEDWLPQSGDTLTYNETVYSIEQTGAANTFYQNVGTYGVIIRIIVMEYRG